MQTARFAGIPGMTLAVMRMLKGRHDARSHTTPRAPLTQIIHIPYERRTNMKRVSLWMIGIGLCITVGLLTVKQGYAEEKDHAPTCTLKTLKGTYQFATTGYNIVDSVPQPIAIVEVIDVNGDGTLNVPAVTLSVNGTILRFADVGGSYTVNEDCTGTITFVTDVHLDIFIAPNGKEFHLIQTDANSVLAAVAIKVSRK
jgi:hypothetical protein